MNVSTPERPRIAVLVPCFNENLTVGAVVRDFLRAVPSATVYVYDNNSTDNTGGIAKDAGAVVRTETRQGKGFVVQRMFADIEADIYVLVDGDDTYEAAAAPRLIDRLLSERLDFVNGARKASEVRAYRPGHRLGNKLLTGLVQRLFGKQFDDMLSGYKVLSRRFVKSFPTTSRGFEIETELMIHALRLSMPSIEVSTIYKERPEGSQSKLRTYHDGLNILLFIVRLLKDERPLMFFGAIGGLTVLVSFFLAAPIVLEFVETGLVPRLPTAVLCASLVVIGIFSIFAGLILDMVSKTRKEVKRLAYLSIPLFSSEPHV